VTTAPNPHPVRRHFPLAFCIAGFAAVDFLGPSIVWAIEAELITGLFAGTVVAQFGLLAIWAALGPQRWTLRLPVTLTYVALFYTTLITGMTVADPSGFLWYDVRAGYLSLPLMFLAVQFPLWIMRSGAGWRIVRADQGNEFPPAQFHLRDLFVATTLIAVALGLASLGLPREGPAAAEAWEFPAVACLVCAAWSVSFTLPCLWAALIAKNWRRSIVVIIVYTLVMSFNLSPIVGEIEGTGQLKDAILLSLPIHVTLVGVMLAVLHVVRRRGYVLRRGGRRKTAVA